MLLRIYTVFYLLFYLVYTFSPKSIALNGTWEWVDIGFMLTALFGMFSYAFEFRVLQRRFWDYFFYLFVIYELVYMAWLEAPLLAKLDMSDKAAITNTVNILMMAPVAWALFKLPQRWNNPGRDGANSSQNGPTSGE